MKGRRVKRAALIFVRGLAWTERLIRGQREELGKMGRQEADDGGVRVRGELSSQWQGTTSQQGIEGQDDARAHLIIGQMEPMNHGGNLTMIEMPAR